MEAHMSADVAKKCFLENIALFGNTQTQAENFNLYTGLAKLADAIDDIERTVNAIQRELSSIKSRIR